METKVIAMYLPQYHCIPENDKFWGKGFTDWTTVRNAKPLFEGHNQPRVPLNYNYYDLSLKENVAWQAKLAKEAGIYGFGVYHYWFNNEQNLLTKPAEIMRDNDDVDINYFLAWDNGNWKRSWSNVSGNAWSPLADGNDSKKGPEILIPYILGEEKDWENHYNYLKSHFIKDKYIKVGNKPVFMIFNYCKDIARMSDYWDMLAKQDGFAGMHIIYRNIEQGGLLNKSNIPANRLAFNYEPAQNAWLRTNIYDRLIRKVKDIIGLHKPNQNYYTYDYDEVWNNLLKNADSTYRAKNVYHGAFVFYDDSPRRGNRGGKVILGETPEKFANYFESLLNISSKQGKEFVFLTAWNEWGEGAYLEPDTNRKDDYLNVIRNILINK